MPVKKTRHTLTAFIADLVLVVLFGIVGHFTHHHSLVPAQVLHTVWPFAAALAAAWLLTVAWRAPLAPLAVGVGLWSTTVLGGLLIRFLLGESNQGAFIVVAAALNFLTLVGWRTIARIAGAKS